MNKGVLFLCLYLAAWVSVGLCGVFCWGMQALSGSTQDLFSDHGSNLGFLCEEHGVLTTGPPEKSLSWNFCSPAALSDDSWHFFARKHFLEGALSVWSFPSVRWLLCARSPSHVRLFGDPRLYSTRLLCPWDFPGKNTGVGCHFLLQGIFPTQGSSLSLPSTALAGGCFTTEPPEKPLKKYL